MTKYQYPVKLIDNHEGGFLLEFPDLPGFNSEIWSMDELEGTGVDALVTILDMYFEAHKLFPAPSAPGPDDKVICLPISVVAKMLLLNTMTSANIRACDLARKLSIKPQEVQRIIDLKHHTKIDTIQSALQALGKDLCLTLA